MQGKPSANAMGTDRKEKLIINKESNPTQASSFYQVSPNNQSSWLGPLAARPPVQLVL